MDIFTTGQKIRAEIIEGIPPNSMIVRHHYEHDTGLYFITLQNDSFEPVKQGDVIPIHQITVKALPPEEADYKLGYDKGYQAAINEVATGERAGDTLPSAADLDAVAAEETAKNATAPEPAVPA